MLVPQLKEKANYIRDEVIRVAVQNKAGHIAPSLSTVDILVALYYKVMQPFALYDAAGEHYALKSGDAWINRDRFILSKAHGCYALYAILADLGIIPESAWEAFNDTSKAIGLPHLTGCASYMPKWGIEAGCGSLGHGLPIAVGMAYAAKLQKKNYRVFVLVGDGELQEGSNWEAIEFASRHNLDNITIIVDYNHLQAMEETQYNEHDIADRVTAFGCGSHIIDGHDMNNLINITNICYDYPKVYIAKTIKGKGLKCMENITKFHYRVPTLEEMQEGTTYGRYSE